MSYYDSEPVSQLPLGTAVKATDYYPAVDTTDLTESPSGSTKKYSITMLQEYLTNQFSGNDIRTAKAAADANLDAAYINGDDGIGATLTNSGALTAISIDGYALSLGDRFLVPFQTNPAHNGVYEVTVIGNGGTPWVGTRVTDFDGSPQGRIEQGDFIGILFGDLNPLSFWFLTSPDVVVVGTDPITFQEQDVSSFTFTDTLFFATGGSDLNVGTNIDSPFATLAHAVSVAESLITISPRFVSIVGIGPGVETGNISIIKSGINIYAPAIALNPTTGDALTVNLAGAGSASYIDVTFASSLVESGAKVLNLIGTTVGNNNVTRFNFLGASTGDVYLDVKCEYYTTFITGLLTANEAGTRVVVQYGIGVQTNQTRLNLVSMLFGPTAGAIHGPMNVTNLWRYPMRQAIYLSGDRTLAFGDSGFLFINNTTNDYVITLPDTTGQGTPAFLFCYEATFLNLSTGSITLVADGASTLIGASLIDGQGQRANASLIAADLWEVDVVNLPIINALQVGTNGKDSNSGTSLLFPKLTVQNALDNGSDGFYFEVGSGNFNENITIPYNCQISAPYAQLNGTGSGDLITVEAAPPDSGGRVVVLDIGDVNQGGPGLALNVLGTNTTVFLTSNVFFGDLDCEGALIVNNAAQVASDIHILSTGTLVMQSMIDVGCTFTFDTGASIVGDVMKLVSPGVTQVTRYGNQIIKDTFTVQDVLLDVTSGSPAAGYVMTYNGVDAINLQPPSTAPTTFFNVTLPWTAWNYLVVTGGGGDFYWATADAQNGNAFAGTSNRDFGDVSLVIPATGTYQFTVALRTGSSGGIATFTIDSVVNTIDTYTAGTEARSLVWTQSLAAGLYSVNLSSLTKNVLSTDYWLTGLYGGLSIELL